MRKMTEKQLKKWEQSRNIGEEILEGIRDIKAGRVGRRGAGGGKGAVTTLAAAIRAV